MHAAGDPVHGAARRQQPGHVHLSPLRDASDHSRSEETDRRCVAEGTLTRRAAVALALGCVGLTAAPADRGDRPMPRTDRNSQIAHAQLVEKARRGGIDIYFEGDSITRRWGASDAQYRDFLLNWRRNFFGWNAANFGWGGDTVQNILWRLENRELDDVHPKIIVLLAGTNNIGSDVRQSVDGAVVEEVTSGIGA